MNNWEQYQSTPKLLPPSVFERTNNTTSESNEHMNSLNNNNNNNNDNMTSNNTTTNAHSLMTTTSTNNESYFAGESQFIQLSNELEKLKKEIHKLHKENECLRHKNKDFIEQAQLYSEATGHRQISIAALEEVIHKQTKEIQALKCELIEEKESNIRKLKEIEQKSGEKISELTQKVKEISEERLSIQVESEKKVESIKLDYDALFKEQNNKIKSLQDEKNSLVEEHKKQVDDLHRVIDELRKEKSELIEENRIKTQTLEQENRNYLNDLQNLRNYVNDSMPTIETIKEMTKEREQYEQQILKIKAKNDLLIKENNSLQIRLKSINEILTIQENQLESKSSSNIEMLSSNEKKRVGLLNKWRNKVFELLIQLKTQEIDFKQEQNSSDKKCQDYAQRLDDQLSKNRILENVIEDKKAELNVLTNDNTILNEQVSTLKEANKSLEKRRKEDLETTSQLKSFVDSLIKQYQTIEESFKSANKKLVHIDQRVEFAKNRLGVVKALYSRKESKLKEEQVRKCNMLDMTTNLSSIHASIQSNESYPNMPHNPLSLELPNSMLDLLENKKSLEERENDAENTLLIKNELEKVLIERDLLANKLQTDIEKMGEKANKMKEDYELTIKSLNDNLKDLRELNEQKQMEIEEVNEKLKIKEHMYDELNKKYVEMETQFAELKNKMSIEIEKKCKERETEFIEKLSKMDQKLNEARREQAKAVVIMRQMERSTNREKERMENMLKSCDNYYKEHLNKLQMKIVSLEKERNTLMSSLKQQSQYTSVENRLNDLKNSNNKVLIEDEFHNKPISSSSSRLKSPQEFLMANSSDPELNKWLNRIKSLNDSNESAANESSLKVNLQQKAMNGELTSFWLESSAHMNEFSLNQTANSNELKCADSQQHFSSHEPIEEQEEAREEDYAEDSSSLKNNEIMKQIRKIMGNLELSDNDDDDQSENELDNAQQCDESRSINEPANERRYEFEHAIDDLFQRKINSFSN